MRIPHKAKGRRQRNEAPTMLEFFCEGSPNLPTRA
jgi:hypothetical protein